MSKIPRNDLVISAIKEVLKRRRVVESQEDLSFLALQELRKQDKDYVLSPRRVKNLALKIPNIEIKAKTKKMPKLTKLERCPVCGKKISKIYGKNLLDQRIQIGYICKSCGYTTDLEALMPMKYIFIWHRRIFKA